MKRSAAVPAILFALAGLPLCAASEAHAQAANSFTLSGAPLPPSLFEHSAPPPLTPEPGGAITSQTVTMPVPPLARTTLPSAGGPSDMSDTSNTSDTKAAAPEDGPAHAALDDHVLDGVH